MNIIILHLIIGNLANLILIFNSSLLFQRFRKDKNPATLWLAAFFSALLVWSICSTFYPLSNSESIAIDLYFIGVFFSYIAFFSLFIFSNLVIQANINLKKAIYFSFLLGAIFIILWGGNSIFYEMPLIPDFGFYAKAFLKFLFFQLAFILSAGYEFLRATFIMYKKSKSKKIRNQTRLIFIGAIIAIPGTIIALVLVEIIFIPSLVLLVAAVGSFFVALAYSKNTEVSYIVPYDCYRLIILDKNGIPAYSYDFIEGTDQLEVFISGALSAINTVMESAVGFKSKIKTIYLEKSALIMDLQEHFGAVLFANRSSVLLQKALKTFLSIFLKHIEEKGLIVKNGKELTEQSKKELDASFLKVFNFVLKK
ncbi:hypothetical protein [Candidatus Harpocratesius sp.]